MVVLEPVRAAAEAPILDVMEVLGPLCHEDDCNASDLVATLRKTPEMEMPAVIVYAAQLAEAPAPMMLVERTADVEQQGLVRAGKWTDAVLVAAAQVDVDDELAFAAVPELAGQQHWHPAQSRRPHLPDSDEVEQDPLKFARSQRRVAVVIVLVDCLWSAHSMAVLWQQSQCELWLAVDEEAWRQAALKIPQMTHQWTDQMLSSAITVVTQLHL